jgi:hypothetical protein
MLFVACVEPSPKERPEKPEPVDPCLPHDQPTLEIAQEEGAPFGLLDGDPIFYGHPPQGGAPYAPFRMRLSGLADLTEVGAAVLAVAVDTHTGETLGTAELNHRWICANVGDDAGFHVGADVHMRFYGWTLEELVGREADLQLLVEDGQGVTVDAGYRGPLVEL